MLDISRTAGPRGIRLPSELTLLGKAMLCFLAAAAGANWLAFTILSSDRDTRRHR
jgi:hypothetical protein